MHEASRANFPWTLKERMDRIARLEAMVMNNKDAIIGAAEADFGGRGRAPSLVFEVATAMNSLRMHLASWIKNEAVEPPLPFNLAGSAYVQRQPLGVVLLITPWNFPFHLAISAMADLIGAGNRIILKPSELAPATSALLADVLGAAFDPLEVFVALGDATVGAELISLPFDHIMFTGSPRVGKIVAQAAAANLTPVTLEYTRPRGPIPHVHIIPAPRTAGAP
jgi:coniferyl-aldehyde dehydrogenase